MRKQFVKDGVIYGGANLISGLSSFLLLPIYTRNLSTESYGVIDYTNSLQVLVQILFLMELTQAIALFSSDSRHANQKKDIASTGLIFAFSSGLFFLIAAFFLYPQWKWAAVAIVLKMILYVVQTQLRWEFRAFAYGICNLCSSIGILLFTWLSFKIFSPSVEIAFQSLSLGYGLGIAIAFYALRKTYRLTCDLSLLKEMLKFSIPLGLSSLALFFSNYGDRLILQRVLGFEDLGIYAAGAKISSIIAICLAGFQMGTAPLIFREHSRPEAPSQIAQLLRFFLLFGLSLCLAVSFVSPEILKLMTSSEYYSAWKVIPFLSFGVILANVYIFTPGLLIKKKSSQFALINITGALVGLSLSWILVSRLGMLGAALAFAAAAVLNAILHIIFSQVHYALPLNRWRTGLGLLVALVSLAALPILMALEQLYRYLFCFLAILLLCFILTTPDEIKSLKKRLS